MKINEYRECLFIRCQTCGNIFSKMEWKNHLYVCRNCGYHMKISARQRIGQLVDAGTFLETNAEMGFINPIDFPGYEEKYLSSKKNTNMNESIITGTASINGYKAALGVMEGNFIMGSMGVVLGEKVSQLFELGIDEKCSVIVVTTSGGARMQEGIAALLQMTKTASVVGRMNDNGILLICVLTSPTTGGVSASFAMLGDITLAEPGALIGFAGPRVIKQTINQDLPKGFQTSEHLLQCGFIDKIVHRNELKRTLSYLLSTHAIRKENDFINQ